MKKKRIMFIKPYLETDAVFDPIRTCPYTGTWYLASLLKQEGYDVKCLDETVRNDGLSKQELFTRTLHGNSFKEERLDISFKEFRDKVMKDFLILSTNAFSKKYTAFVDNKVVRTIVRTGCQIKDTLEQIRSFAPDVVGIPLIATANYIPATNLANSIKNMFPYIKIIFGGQHISVDPDGFLKENPQVDNVIVGDAITSIIDVVEGRTTNSIIKGNFQTMDKFPLLDFSFIKDVGYPINPTYTYPTMGRQAIDYMFSKGCWRKCDFCVAGCQDDNNVTAINYDTVDKQLHLFAENGNIEIVVQDDAFLWDKRHVQKHLSTILKLMKKYGIFWQNNGGIEFELLDESVTNLFVKYNQNGDGRITSLYVPFNPRSWNKTQSACKTMVNRYHKNLDNLKKLRDAGIYIFTSSIVGTPEQDEGMFWKDLEVSRSLITDGYIDASFALSATMLPGTNWYKSNGHNIVNKKDYPGFSLFATHHRTPFLEPQDIERLTISWMKELRDVQQTFPWQTAFFDSS